MKLSSKLRFPSHREILQYTTGAFASFLAYKHTNSTNLEMVILIFLTYGATLSVTKTISTLTNYRKAKTANEEALFEDESVPPETTPNS